MPGEVVFVADQANFTPEKIETRSDRLGQVYRAKVRILEGVERFQPGTEGNVYLLGGRRATHRQRDGPRRRDERGSGAREAPHSRSTCSSSASASARSARSTASISSSPASSWWAWSVPTARARRRCCARWPGLLEVEAQRAEVLGHDLRGDVRALKAQIGYVPQVFALNRELSVLENLRFTGRLHRIPAADFERRVEELLARTAMTPFADRPAGALSGGMKQKLAVANALLPEPALLVLDECTAGVDVVARAEISRAARRASQRGAGAALDQLSRRSRRLRSPGLSGRRAAWSRPERRTSCARASRSRSIASGARRRARSPWRRARCPTSSRCAPAAAARASRSRRIAAPAQARVLADLAGARRRAPGRGAAARHGVGAARARARSRRMSEPIIHATGLTKRFGDLHRRRRSHALGRARRDLRVPRRQRLRQEHDDPHADRTARAQRRHDAASTAST